MCFKGEDDGFIYSCFFNLIVKMFEDWMCFLEGVLVVCVIVIGMVVVMVFLFC